MGDFFATTQWSMILDAGEEMGTSSEVALSQLCKIYRPAVYKYYRVVIGSEHDADDMTQSFFEYFLDFLLSRMAV